MCEISPRNYGNHEIPVGKEGLAAIVEGTLWLCAANLGRSQLAEGIFHTNYPNIPVLSAALGFWHINGYRSVPWETLNTLKEYRMNIDNPRQKAVNEVSWILKRYPKKFDVFILDAGLIQHIPRSVSENARSMVGFDLLDPSEVKGMSLHHAMHYTYSSLDILIREQLPGIMQRVRNDDYKDVIDGVVFPFGVPESLRSSPDQDKLNLDTFRGIFGSPGSDLFGPLR